MVSIIYNNGVRKLIFALENGNATLLDETYFPADQASCENVDDFITFIESTISAIPAEISKTILTQIREEINKDQMEQDLDIFIDDFRIIRKRKNGIEIQ